MMFRYLLFDGFRGLRILIILDYSYRFSQRWLLLQFRGAGHSIGISKLQDSVASLSVGIMAVVVQGRLLDTLESITELRNSVLWGL